MTHPNPNLPHRQRPRRLVPWLFLGFIGVLLIGLAVSCVSAGAKAVRSVTTPKPVTYEVEVKGGGQAMISYTTKSGVSQETAMTPWSKPVEGSFGGSLSAQKKSGGPAQITCRVRNGDGEVIAENVSSGPYAVCTSAGF